MIPRATIIATLILIETVIVGESIVAVRGDQPSESSMQRVFADAGSGSNLVEGGQSRLFDAESHPALSVDIGNADLTIRTAETTQFDVSVSKSSAYGMFRATAPITARKDGETIRIATTDGRHWSLGDDRMVTVIVPAQTRVTVVNAGDIRANGLHGESAFTSANGTIKIEDYNAPSLHVTASDGRISLFRIVANRFDVTSSDGRIEGTALQVRDGSVESEDGRVTLGFAPGADTLVTAQTSNGRVRVSGFTAAASTAGARSSGDDSDDSSSRTVRVGAGTGRLDVHSSDGNIDLSQ